MTEIAQTYAGYSSASRGVSAPEKGTNSGDDSSSSFSSLLDEQAIDAGGAQANPQPPAKAGSETTPAAAPAVSTGQEPWLMSAEDLALLAGDIASEPGSPSEPPTGAEPAATKPAGAEPASMEPVKTGVSASASGVGGIEPAPSQTADAEKPVSDTEAFSAQLAIAQMREALMRFAPTSVRIDQSI